MLKVILSGSSLNKENIINEVINRATEKKQGADAIVTKHKGRSAKVFLIVDNRQILFKQRSRMKTFIIGDYKSVVFPATVK